MSIQENHNHFCIYCGSKLFPDQHFCSKCGKEVYHEQHEQKIQNSSHYIEDIEKIESNYNLKELKAMELVEKFFNPSSSSYQKFI